LAGITNANADDTGFLLHEDSFILKDLGKNLANTTEIAKFARTKSLKARRNKIWTR
jgi:hypothetical protein